MGRRSRRREADSGRESRQAEGATGRASHRGSYGDAAERRPTAPWGAFPLTELTVLAAFILVGIGFFSSGGRSRVLLVLGLVLGSLAGLELAVREHFAGYRSHTTLLAGVLAFTVLALLFFTVPATVLSPTERIGAAGVVFVPAFVSLRRLFKRRSGGRGFR